MMMTVMMCHLFTDEEVESKLDERKDDNEDKRGESIGSFDGVT